jgi:hypothetical protein
MIRIPGIGEAIYQNKQLSSGYEGDLRDGDGPRVYRGTMMGNFAVVVCSDFVENDVIQPIVNSTRDLDLIIVVSCNPYPRLFEAMAVAEAARAYCHVVVVNNFMDRKEPEKATAEGTVACSPLRNDEDRQRSPVRRLPIGRPAIGGEPAEIGILELSPLRLDRGQESRPAGHLRVPRSRRM